MQRRKQRPQMTYEELIAAWVKDHGEAITAKEAAALVGVSMSTIYRCMDSGAVRVTPNKRVLVRSLCAYANTFPEPVLRL